MNMIKLLQKMTLKEKVGQLNQRLYGWEIYEKKAGSIFLTEKFKKEVQRWGSIGCIYGVFRSDPWSGKNQETGLSIEEAKQVSSLVQDYLKKNTRLGIPTFLSEECPHGHQALDSLTTPTNSTVGMSWNPLLYQKLQQIVARELRIKGAHLGLISTLDVSRDPRWGRTEECYGEDPFLTSQFTIAAVEGLQGKPNQKIDNQHVLAVLKHFAAQGSGMGGHNSGPVGIGQREFREIHLPPMIQGIKQGAQMTMAAYNDIDGIPCHGNGQLLNELLRDELGFTGAVMADGCALDRLVEITEDPIQAAVWAIKSGVDISLWDEVFPHLETAIEQGALSETILDTAVLRVLNLKNKMGLFEDIMAPTEDVPLLEKKLTATQMAKESIVLLKNEQQVLPLSQSQLNSLAVIGPNAHSLYNQLGDYTPFKNERECSTVLEGLQQKCKENHIDIVYHQGSNIVSKLPDGISQAVRVSKEADKIIVVLGGSSARDFTTQFDANGAALSGSNEMTSGENIDLADLRIPKAQVELVKELSNLGKPMIGVFIQGRPHILSEVEPYLDAILVAGYPGEHGGEAIASILFEESPSGKLTMSIPRHNGQLPVYYNYREIAFKKDYTDSPGKPDFPFGYGLSYTTFSLNELLIARNDSNALIISGTITNTGSYAGAEVIQIYIKSHQKKVVTRVKELKGFKKIQLESKETKNFEISLDSEDLMELNERLETKKMQDITLIIECTENYFEQRIDLIN